MAKRKRESADHAAAPKAVKSRKNGVAPAPKPAEAKEVAIRKRKEGATNGKAAANKAATDKGAQVNPSTEDEIGRAHV